MKCDQTIHNFDIELMECTKDIRLGLSVNPLGVVAGLTRTMME